GLTVAIGLASVDAIEDQITEFRQNVTPAVDGAGQLRTSLTLAQSNFRGYALTGQPLLLEDYEAQRALVEQLEADLAARPEVVDPVRIEAVIQQTQEWFELTTPLVSRTEDVTPQDLVATRQAYDEIVTDYDLLYTQILETRGVLREEYRQVINVGKGAILVAGLLGVATVLLSTRRVGTRLAAPLSELGDVVARHQRGDTAVRARVGKGSEEVQSVSAAFNSLADATELAERHTQEDMELARMVGAVSNILTASVTDESHWDEACSELGRSLGLDCVAIVAHQEVPATTSLGHWGCDRHGEAENLAAGFAAAVEPGETTGPGLLLAETPEEVERRFPSLAAEIMRQHGAQAGALAVLCESDRVIGALFLLSVQPRIWQEREVAAIKDVAITCTQFLEQREVVERLRELDRQKSDFMATTSHELRTPLTSISGYLEVLEDGDLGELTTPQRRALGVLGRNVNRLRALIEDLLILNQLDSGKGGAARERVDLRRSIVEVIQNLDPIAAKKGIALIGPRPELTGDNTTSDDTTTDDTTTDDTTSDDTTTDDPTSDDSAGACRADEFHVLGDRDQLERALTNVVSNAVKFTPTGKQVTVGVRLQDSRVEVVCEDSGIGIPTEELKDLFVRFFRASNAVREQVQGSGLGLPIVLAIVEGHRGTVDVSSREGRGTRVTINLPAADAED
ncbi:MAG: ATP-binding protein, partial [Ornithinimicrobium sp.]